MENTPVSPMEDLHAAIQSRNPFDKPAIVKDPDVWGEGFPDVPTLNAHASDAVFQALEWVRTSQSSQDKVTSFVITAQQGVGKSHIISRIRHRLEREGGGVFVYASVDKYGDLNLMKSQFQKTLAESLKQRGSQGVMQWQEVATAMVNTATKTQNSPTNMIANKFPYALAKNNKLMEHLTEAVLRNKPQADPYIVRAILWTLSETRAPFAIKWLSGEELEQSHAAELGLPNPTRTNPDRENKALDTVRQILNLVTAYQTAIICFDEIDVLNNCNEAGLTTPQVVADLVKRLFDTVHQSPSSTGVVFLTVMMPDTWAKTVKLLGGGIPDRVSAKGSPIDLKYLGGDSFVELISLWLQEFYQSRNLTPPQPLYPFEETELREFAEQKPTVREALRWCAENFKVPAPQLPENPAERFELALTRELEADFKEHLKDNSRIAEALKFGFHTLTGQTVEGVTIEAVTDVFVKDGIKDKYINFKVNGQENGKAVKIGVAVLESRSNSLVYGLERLNNYRKYDLTRGCLVRSAEKRINRNSMSHFWLHQLTSKMGGEFVRLIEEQIIPIFAAYSAFHKREAYKLSEEQFFEFISQKRLILDNPLLREILSAPSGHIPDDAVGEDSTDDLDDLGDLFN
ncbi:P-loop NTPase fold protein [Kamptonema formosum]|uniref:P-loop NTPase fold protein n=1 Tax=Kamptonema formosum TaxID=331992 RepID=UPI00034D25A0|nr:P-loop NTPase fold protein [Oscillatoria sp. PCC 10802]